MAENVLFGSEFDGRPIIEGVNEVVQKLAEIKQAQKDLRDETNRLNKALDDNQKELNETKTALDAATKAGDPKKIKELSDQVTNLTTQEQKLKTSLKEANTELIVLQKGAGVYSRQINETVKNHLAVNEQLGKFASVSRVAGEAVGRLRTFVQEAAFGLVSGLAGGIIATVLPALISFVSNLFKAGDAAEALARKQELQNSVMEDAAKSVAGQVAKLESFRKILTNTKIEEEERIRVAKEFNKTADEKNQIDTTQINNLNEINRLLDIQKTRLIDVAVANAAVGKIAEAAQPFLAASLKFKLAAANFGIDEEQLKTFVNFNNKLRENLDISEARVSKTIKQREEDNKILDNFAKNAGISQKQFAQLTNDLETIGKTKKNLDEVTGALQSLINVQGVVGQDKGGGEDKTNVFTRELLRLQQALSATKGQALPSESIIEEQFKQKLQAEINNINKFLDAKSREQVTPEQAAFLKSLAEKINALQLETSLEELRKKIQDLTNKLNDQITQAQTEDANKRIANIRDDFEREKAQIEQGFTNTAAALTKARDGVLKQIDEAEKAGQDHATSQRQRILANSIFGDLTDQATVTKTNQQLDLTFKTFQNTLTQSNTFFEETLTQLDENIAKRIVAEKDNLATGAINYETFQKRVTALLKQQKEERDQIRKEELNSDLNQINIKLNSTTDPEQVKKLQDQARGIREQIAAIDSNVEGQKQDDPTKKRIENIQKYASSVGSLLNSIGSFWQQVNAIEEKSLERSISLQQKRVEEAKVIAERGNAEYLNQEQDRLDQLELKRAASARKQQAINSALVLSQALVATVSAIAQAASTSGPAAPFAAIAAGIAVIGAITAAFQFVNSLQPPVAEFRHGTEEVQVGRNKPGIDTVPAKLTAGERVVTVRENKEYFETLTAIHNRKVSPEVLNSFVRQTLTGQKQGQGEKRIERTVIERFREKAEKDRLTKEDRQLTKEIANEVSTKIINNTEKDRVFNYVEHVLTEKFDTRPVIVPRIMKLIREQVTEKEVSKERTTVQAIASVIETFSDRIRDTIKTEKYSTTSASKYSKEVVDFIKENSDYRETLEAVFDKRIEARTMNNFVQTVVQKTLQEKTLQQILTSKEITNQVLQRAKLEVPVVSFQRLEQATNQSTEMKALAGEQIRIMKENNELQKETHKVLKAMGFSFNFDRNGVSAMMMKYMDQQKIDLKT